IAPLLRGMRGLPGTRLALGLPQPFRQSARKGATDLIGWRSFAAPAIAQPHASRLAQPGRHRKSRSRIERSRRRRADDRNELDEFACAIAQGPPEDGATTDRTTELRKRVARPGDAVALRERAQHQGQHAGKAADADQRDRNSARASRGNAVAIDQRANALAYPVALGVAARAKQRLVGAETLRLEDALQRLKAKVLRRETILGQRKIERHELRR